MRHDLELRNLLECWAVENFTRTLKTDVAKKHSEALFKRYRNIRHLASLPVYMVRFASMWPECVEEAFNNYPHPPKDSPPGSMTLGIGKAALHTLHRMARNVMQRKIDKQEESRPHFRIGLTDLPPDADIDFFLSRTDAGHDTGTQFLFSLCVHAWTMFEVLASDLWKDALDSDPKHLGSKSAAYIARGTDETADTIVGTSTKEKFVKIPLDVLIDCNWNVSQKLGTYTRAKFKFRTFDGILDAFRRIWPDHYDFSTVFDPLLREVAALRNVIVHAGGVADIEFKSQVRSDGPFSNFTVGQPIPITGPMTQSVCIQTWVRARSLLQLVDQSLSGTPVNSTDSSHPST